MKPYAIWLHFVESGFVNEWKLISDAEDAAIHATGLTAVKLAESATHTVMQHQTGGSTRDRPEAMAGRDSG